MALRLQRDVRFETAQQEFFDAYAAYVLAGNGEGKLTPARRRLRKARRALRRFNGWMQAQEQWPADNGQFGVGA